jgi:hypothetical protein
MSTTEREHAALTLLIMGRTATAAAEAILAAGWRPPIHVHEPEVLDVSKNPSFGNSSITLCRDCREILEWK